MVNADVIIIILQKRGGTEIMSNITVTDLTFAYDGDPVNVFEHVSFRIDTDWKLGFIGRNGRGKTTFLRLLMGQYRYTGRISSSVSFSYFPYTIKSEDEYILAGELASQICPEAEEWEIVRELSLLGVTSDVLYRPLCTLSQGERTKLMLAGLFLGGKGFPLIDEPTNHLDSEGREAVAEYLSGKKGFILVSHDRAFLDRSVDHILSINRSNIEVRSGNFSSWYENFERQQSYEMARNEKLMKDIEDLKEASRRTAVWADRVEASKKGTRNSGIRPDRGYIGHKSAKMMKRATVLLTRQEKAIEEKSGLLKNAEEDESLRLYPLEFRQPRLLKLRDVQVRYGGKPVTGKISFELMRGQRIALEGKNGCGKSSILKLICGEALDYEGEAELASGLVISYMPQSTDGLTGSISDFARNNGIDENRFRAALRKLNFARTQFDKDISEYSGGQKKKVLLAASLCKNAHLYVWDEPLNFIDIYSRMQIEELISEFSPTMIFVEHDKMFRERIATEVISL